MLHFRQVKPHPGLCNFVRGYWLLESSALPEQLELVPDGYPEMFFVLNGSVQIFSAQNCRGKFAPTGLIGQATGRFSFQTSPHTSALFVKLYPWTPHLLFGISAREINDSVLDVETVSSDPEFRNLDARVYAAPNLEGAARVLDAFFLKKTAALSNKGAFVQHAVRQIFNSNGALSIDSLRERIWASRRYVEKTFKETIGLTPKRYAQLVRVKKASMCLLDPRFQGNIQDIALSLEYYDQSHFLKDFKAIVGCSPSAFLKSQLNLSEEGLLPYLDQWDYS